jgi:hypothetical protein
MTNTKALTWKIIATAVWEIETDSVAFNDWWIKTMEAWTITMPAAIRELAGIKGLRLTRVDFVSGDSCQVSDYPDQVIQ